MKTTLRILALIAAIVALSPAAYATEGPMKGACKADVQALCSGVQPGGGKIAHCLKEHREQLSEGCKSAMKERHAAHKAHKGMAPASGDAPAPAPETEPAQ